VPGLPAAPRVVVALVLGALVVVGLTAGLSSGATGPAVVRLTDLQTKLTPFGHSVGGGEVARLTLYGSRSTKRAIGHGVLLCTFVGDSERHCEGSYVLPRGTIETAGVLKSRLIYMHAITGGTGLYDNARGTLTVTAKGLRPRREILVFRLSG
jgi:fermentation-respiration switch protein FrsA (DUF1100 family)